MAARGPLRPRVRPPNGLAYITRDRCDLLLDAAIRRRRREHTASVHTRRIDDLRAVRREARRFVELPSGQTRVVAARGVDDTDLIRVVLSMDDCDQLAVRRDPRARGVGPAERNALRAPAGLRGDLVDRWAARTVGVEVDRA